MIRLILCALLLTTISFCHAQTAKELYERGSELKKQSKIPEAIAAFKDAVKIDPNYKEALYDLGWCQNDVKEYTSALANLRKARSLWPGNARVLFELGYAFEKLNYTDSAVISYGGCLFINSSYSSAYKQLGYIAYNKNDNVKALEYFSSYEAKAPNAITDYLYWYRKGFASNATKNYEQAKTALLKSLEFKKDYVNTYLELGFASSRLKQNEEAINHYKKAMELDPKSHISYNGIAEVYRDNFKNCTEAISWYRKALEVKTNERKANFGIGYCLNSAGNYSEALPYLKKAIEYEPDYVAAHVELGFNYYKTGNSTLALESFQKAVSLNKANENARYYSTLLYIDQRNKIQAQKMVDELKALNSKHVATLQEKVNKM